jgi:hypothetical protein
VAIGRLLLIETLARHEPLDTDHDGGRAPAYAPGAKSVRDLTPRLTARHRRDEFLVPRGGLVDTQSRKPFRCRFHLASVPAVGPRPEPAVRVLLGLTTLTRSDEVGGPGKPGESDYLPLPCMVTSEIRGQVSAGRVRLHHVERRSSASAGPRIPRCTLVVKWDLDSQTAMKGAATRRILDLISELEAEGLL